MMVARTRLGLPWVVLVIVGVLSTGCSSSPATSFPSHQDPESLQGDDLGALFKELDEASNVPGSEVDIALMSLKIARVAYPALDLEGCIRRLDEFARTVRSQVGPGADAQTTLRAMAKVFFEDCHLRCVTEGSQFSVENRWLHHLFDSGRGTCINFSLLYLGVSHRLGFRLQLVTAPRHAFVRFADGERHVNVETTANGDILSDESYEEKFLIKRGGCYLRGHTAKEALALLLSQVAIDLDLLDRDERSLACHKQAMAMFRTSPDILANYGTHLLGRWKNYMEAEIVIKQALEIYPSHALSLISKAQILEHQDRDREALACLDEALRVDPDLEIAVHRKAVLLMNSDRYDEALLLCQQALERNPKLNSVACMLPRVFYSLGDYSKALSAFDRALEIKPRDHEMWVVRGDCLVRLKRKQEALESFEKALVVAPKYSQALAAKAMIFLDWKQIEPALVYANDAVEADPSDGRSWLSKGLVHYVRQEWRLALDCLEKAQKLGRPAPDSVMSKVRKEAAAQEEVPTPR